MKHFAGETKRNYRRVRIDFCRAIWRFSERVAFPYKNVVKQLPYRPPRRRDIYRIAYVARWFRRTCIIPVERLVCVCTLERAENFGRRLTYVVTRDGSRWRWRQRPIKLTYDARSNIALGVFNNRLRYLRVCVRNRCVRTLQKTPRRSVRNLYVVLSEPIYILPKYRRPSLHNVNSV